MPLPIAHILGILAENLGKRKTVMPLPRRRATGWAQGLDIPMGGETVLYTGHMYQIIPSLASMEKMMGLFENSWITFSFGMGRLANKVVNLSWFMAWPSRQEQRAYDNRLRNIVCLLRAANVEFGYLYGEELYAGALVHDGGVDDVFERHAHRVYEMLQRHDVKRVITVDPHTTNMLRSVYPEIIEGYQLEVKSYLEVLAERDMDPRQELDLDVVIHDSCVYARYENVVDEPRRLLEKAGAKLIEPEYTGKLTFCCGGPVESLFPSKAREIADKRIEQLASAGSHVAAMCPICLINLQNASKNRDVSVKDISEYLVQAYCGVSQDQAAAQD